MTNIGSILRALDEKVSDDEVQQIITKVCEYT